MRTKSRRRIGFAAPAILAIGLLIAWSCEFPSGELNANKFPTTSLANVPPNDTIGVYLEQGVLPEMKLYWTGGDEDGYVIAFRYRWVDVRNGQESPTEWTTLLNVYDLGGSQLLNVLKVKGSSLYRIYNYLITLNSEDQDDVPFIAQISDSIETLRMFAVPYQTGIIPGDSISGVDPVMVQTPTTGTFIFDSPDLANIHRFEVKSVDNSDAEDPTPAMVHFWTKQAPTPKVLILSSPPAGSLAIRCITERWQGLRFTFGKDDPSTDIQEFSWDVDGQNNWSPWDPFPEAHVTALDFDPLRIDSTTHTFAVRCRNRWGVVSRDSVIPFTAFVPKFDGPNFVRRTLIINNDPKLASSPAGTPDSVMVNTFFTNVMNAIGKSGKFDIWTTQSALPLRGAFPSREILGAYSSMVLLSEFKIAPLGGGNFTMGSKIPLLTDYLLAGGKLINCGQISPISGWGQTAYPGWSSEFWHADSVVVSATKDFVGATGVLGYPNLRLDPAKVPVDPACGVPSLAELALHFPKGFAESIMLYSSCPANPAFEGNPVGVRYLGPPADPGCRPTYSIVNFGVPMYFVMQDDVVQAFQKAFDDIQE